jgi:hypothetical protein
MDPAFSLGQVEMFHADCIEWLRRQMTMRGGDRPKNAHLEFPDVTVMPRSMWEPWLLYRRPLEGRVQDNLRKWRTGGLRRVSGSQPFGDVVKSRPTPANERAIAIPRLAGLIERFAEDPPSSAAPRPTDR